MGKEQMDTTYPKCMGSKMQPYMLLYGCAENFHGGMGESAHKVFVKAPGLKTQRRVSKFAVQTAKQYHHVMISRHSYTSMSLGNPLANSSILLSEIQSTVMDGKYSINMMTKNVEEKISFLHDDLIQFYHDNWREICRHSGTSTTIITGYTRWHYIDYEGHQTIFYAHPSYRGSPWYDWAYVHFVESNNEEAYYPSKVLGFFETAGGVEAVIHCASRVAVDSGGWALRRTAIAPQFEIIVRRHHATPTAYPPLFCHPPALSTATLVNR